MLKYVDAKVVFQEIPDEITLAINISNCPCKCTGCHSQYLAEDIGEELTDTKLMELIDSNKGITCVALMGGDSDPAEVIRLLTSYISYMAYARPNDKVVKTAWYSGRAELPKDLDWGLLNYIKLGPYIEEFGPLTSRTTNQLLLEVDTSCGKPMVKDITSRFWK